MIKDVAITIFWTVVDVIQSGYKLEGEVLRPAKVVVSKNSEEKEIKEKSE